jgi:hypothetical protein
MVFLFYIIIGRIFLFVFIPSIHNLYFSYPPPPLHFYRPCMNAPPPPNDDHVNDAPPLFAEAPITDAPPPSLLIHILLHTHINIHMVLLHMDHMMFHSVLLLHSLSCLVLISHMVLLHMAPVLQKS